MSSSDPVALLKELIGCPSVTPQTAGVLDVVERALRPLGFAVTRLRFEGEGSHPVDNLFATRDRGGPHLLFAGHTDVVPPGEGWTHDPFAADEADGVIYGRGAADMKSGIAAFIAALGMTPRTGTVSLAITNDEEADAVNGTEKIMAWAASRGYRFDFAIVGEPSATASVGDSIKIGRRGSLNGRITVTGVQGHVAYPDRARNPLPVAAALVSVLSGKLDAGSPHFPPSNLEFTSIDVGNPTTNVIPAAARLLFNVRYNDRWTPDTLVAVIEERMGGIDARGSAVSFELNGRPSRSFLSPQGEDVDTLIRVIVAETGRKPDLSTGGGTSDARFVAPYCPVVELGLPGPSMHKADEHVRIADLRALMRLYAAFLAAYLK